jgi:hypothetical protein
MPALLKFLVLSAIFLSASNANAFICLSPIARNQVLGNHFIQFEEPMNNPKKYQLANQRANQPLIKCMIKEQND